MSVLNRALSVVLVLAVAASIGLGIRVYQLREVDNVALADAEMTREVTSSVSAALKSVFSYDHANLDRVRRAAESALTGQAATEYRAEFDAAAKRAAEGELVQVSTVRAIGVRELSDETARVLVFLDQQTLTPGQDPESATATLDVTAELLDGDWRISRIESL